MLATHEPAVVAGEDGHLLAELGGEGSAGTRRELLGGLAFEENENDNENKTSDTV